MSIKPTTHNGYQDKEIEHIWKSFDSLEKTFRVVNHNTTTMAKKVIKMEVNMKWMVTIMLLILGVMVRGMFP